MQAPATEAQFRQRMAQIRLLGATLQERLALVDTSYSAGSRQHARLQTQVRFGLRILQRGRHRAMFVVGRSGGE